jgi:uncharacterized protein YutE (UPF0331/DUF86 family)
MVDTDILRRRIDALLDYLSRLERFRAVDRRRFVADPDTHHLAERYLHLAIEAALDIANHVIADHGYEAPATYRDAFAVLAAHSVLEPDLAARLQGWAGLAQRARARVSGHRSRHRVGCHRGRSGRAPRAGGDCGRAALRGADHRP